MKGLSVRVRLEKRQKVSLLRKILTPLAGILLAFVLIGIVMLFLGYNPVRSYTYLFKGAVGSWTNFSETVLQSIPLIFASLGVAIALSMSTMNIGAEGQYAMGAWAATAIGVFCPGIPSALVLPLMLVCGFAAGAVWGMAAVFPRAKWDVSETITTLMFNYIALQWINYWLFGPWRDKDSQNLPLSPSLPAQGRFATLGGTRVHVGIFIALVAAAVIYFVMTRTVTGYKIRVIGRSPLAAQYAGMSIGKTMMLTMMFSGGLAGVAGVMQVGGAAGRLFPNIAGGAGYTALIIARLAKNNPLLIVLISLLFGGITQGSYSLQMANVPWQLSELLQGAILLCTLGGEILVSSRLVLRVQREEPAAPPLPTTDKEGA
ncbi:ABC transporter permease [Clostridia bacterium OttesenSCG-928-O13]|nr:ABC transporter permease [Clostridia bacterium OttesenSCG-928-O13]